jgi:L-alanine-DL-glutamate epimerase-like enolase superfamily enzyme
MNITGIELYPLPFPFVSGGYTTSYGTRTHLNNLLLLVKTDSDYVGLGEICRKSGSSPEPTSTAFTQRCSAILQTVVGADPLDLQSVSTRLGDLEDDFSNLSSALETACFDLLAKSTNRPLWQLLGGKTQESVPIYHTIGQSTPLRMAAEARLAQQQSCRVLQVKVGAGEGPAYDIACIDALLSTLCDDAVMLVDANGGWSADSALTVIAGFSDTRIYWEEPCKTYTENRQVAARSGATIILDQCVTSPEVALRACRDGEVQGMGIKCTMQGGLQAGRRSRDLAIEYGLKLKVDDSWSADVACAASLHLAMAVPPQQLIASVDMRPYFHGRACTEGPVCEAYRLAPNVLPGLGLVADLAALGEPLR